MVVLILSLVILLMGVFIYREFGYLSWCRL